MSSSSSSKCGPCTRASDNAAWECPPRMADGRLFTDYRPRCDIGLQYKAPMTGSYEYRQYMISNGQRIIDAQRAAALSQSRCGPCRAPYDISTMAPEVDRVVCDKVSCTRVKMPRPPAGAPPPIGTGREYGMTPDAAAASAAFLKARREEQNALARPADGKANCCACPSPLAARGFAAAGVAPSAPNAPPARWAVPGAGAPLAGADPGNLSGVACA